MYPNISFRKAYDMLRNRYTNESANKYYIELLYLAKMYSESEVTTALDKLLKDKVVPKSHLVTPHLIQEVKIPDVQVDQPDLEEYNQLLGVQK